MFFFLLFLVSHSLFSNFSKKLLYLMILEFFMILCIFSYFLMFNFSSSLFFLFYLSLFMVIDSVLGISLLIFDSRFSSIWSSYLFLG